MPTTTPFNNLITFSRGSNATVTGPNGLIQWAPSNLVTFSEQFDNAAWTKNAATITANNAAAPDGTSTADTFSADGTTNIHFVRQTVAAFVFPWVFSAYIKAGTANFVQMFFGVDTAVWANFDIATGVVGSVGSNQTASITPVGNGWYRCSIFSNSSTATNPAVAIVSSASAARAEINSLSTNVLIWGAQLELGSTATTYNSTTVKNLLGFSEAFDNAAWVKSNSSIVTGAQANPVNGLFTAQKLMENTANSVHRFIVGATLTAAPYTMSIYAKAAERNWIAVGNTSVGQLAHFNLSNGTVGTIIGSATAAITNIGSGWYRCSVTFTPAAGAITLAVWLASADNTLTYTGDGNSGVYIYGAQLSDSASLDPYVPTPGAAPSSTAFYGPRFDFDPVTLLPRGLLVEEQRTNLQIRSEEFNGAPWTPTNLSVITANSSTAPDGTMTADLLVSAVGAGVTGIVVTSVTFSALTYTQSVFVKAATGVRYIQLLWASGVTSSDYANFDLQTGAVTGGVYSSASMTNFGNGWYRVSLTSVAGASTSGMWIAAVPSGTSVRAAAYTGNGTDSILIWGAQLEIGTFATSYIPTLASTVTRSADVATVSGSLFSQWYAATAGTFVADFDVIWSGNAPASMGIIGLDASASKRFAYISNGSQVASTFDGVLAVGTANNIGSAVNKVASAYDTSRYIALNGGAVATGTLAAGYSSGTSLDIGKYGTLNFLNGHIRNIRFVPARAADFQLQALTELPLVPTLDLDFLNNLYEA